MRRCSTKIRHSRRLRNCETAPPTYGTHVRIHQGARKVCSTIVHLDKLYSVAGGKTIHLTLTEKAQTMRGLL